MTAEPSAGTVARAHRALEPLHSMLYFSPEQDEELTRIGLRPGRMAYFASRSAPMGAVAAPVTAATFYNFNPSLVARHIPRAWTLATPAEILDARFVAVDRALRRLLGDAVAGSEVGELGDLVRTAVTDLPVAGRPLFAGHAELDWPSEPHLALWHAISLEREFRGDGHVAALVEAQLSGIEALVTHTVTGRGFTVQAAKATRGWSDDEWAGAVAGLQERDLLDASGTEFTAGGNALRDAVERTTDRLGALPWTRLDEAQLARVVELGKAFSRRIAAAGAWPDGVFAAR